MKYVNYSQVIVVKCDNPEAIVELIAAWDRNQATSDIMGYMGSHVLVDRVTPGQCLIVAEFAVVDPDVSAVEEAARNNERPETQEWARKLLGVIDGEPVYLHYDEIYRTG